jgi:3-keto-L-gulonate-6-phosphate decarboxylase
VGTAKLRLAIDFCILDEAGEILREVGDLVVILEAGPPLIFRGGSPRSRG